VDQLIHKLHAPVAFFVMPVFALANAGVILSGVELPADTQNVFFGVALGLLLGKPFGIFMASFIAIKTGFSRMPQGMRFRGILLVGMVSAIGFTMAIFISQLAFSEAAFGEASSRIQETSKLAILTASFIAAVVSLGIGFLRPKVHAPPGEEV
jgi:NhaA family Na+:H+ antiporter